MSPRYRALSREPPSKSSLTRVHPRRHRTSSQLSLLSRPHRSGSRRALLRERENVRGRARAPAPRSRGSASRREMLSHFCRRHHLSRRKAPCITSGVYPRSRHPVVTGHLPPPRRSSTGSSSPLSRYVQEFSTLSVAPTSRSPLLLTIDHHHHLSLSLSPYLLPLPPPRLC